MGSGGHPLLVVALKPALHVFKSANVTGLRCFVVPPVISKSIRPSEANPPEPNIEVTELMAQCPEYDSDFGCKTGNRHRWSPTSCRNRPSPDMRRPSGHFEIQKGTQKPEEYRTSP